MDKTWYWIGLTLLSLSCGANGASEPDGTLDGVEPGTQGVDVEKDTNSETPALFTPFGKLQEEVLIPRCANGSCHAGPAKAANGFLSLDGESALSELVGVESSNPNAKNEGLLRIAPGNLEASFVWLKVHLEGPDDDYGTPMPPVAFDPLSEEDREELKAWILSLPEEGDSAPLPEADR